MNLTKIEVLIDKLALLQESLKAQDAVDVVDLQLLRRYAVQLAGLVDEELSRYHPAAPAPLTVTDQALPVTDSPAEVSQQHDEEPAFTLSLPEESVEADADISQEETLEEAEAQGQGIHFMDDAFDMSADETPEEVIVSEPTPMQPELEKPVEKPATSSLFSEDEEDDSLNERFKGNEADLLEKLKRQPIRSLKEEIDLNQKFWFTNELLQGDGARFNHLLDLMDKCNGVQEATDLLRKELGNALFEEEKSRVFHKLLELVERRFMG